LLRGPDGKVVGVSDKRRKPVHFTCTHGFSGFSPSDSEKERLSAEWGATMESLDLILEKRSLLYHIKNVCRSIASSVADILK
jgi:hypothetical protein